MIEEAQPSPFQSALSNPKSAISFPGCDKKPLLAFNTIRLQYPAFPNGRNRERAELTEQPLPYATPAANRRHAKYPAVAALHFLAVLTACATFPLIFMGGLVTSHQAGMSVPDWPNSYGYNMFLFPPKFWIGGIFYEHTHRLMATVVGFLSIALVAASFLQTESVGWKHRWLALSVLGAVLFQGILGGLRVVLVKLDLAIVHACVAQAFFCLAVFAALVNLSLVERSADTRQTMRSRPRLGAARNRHRLDHLSPTDCRRDDAALPGGPGHPRPPAGVRQTASADAQLINWMPSTVSAPGTGTSTR